MSVAVLDLPYVGVALLGLFAVLSLLPVLDLVRGAVGWTAWLVLPALLGALPLAGLFLALSSVPRWLRAAWASASGSAVEIGPASTVLLAADLALLLLGIVAVAMRWAGRRRRVATRRA